MSERILRADSATRELESWCQEHGIGDGRIAAFVDTNVVTQTLDDDSLDQLGHPEARQLTKFRCVGLATAGVVVATALNWYFPGSLTPDMNRQLLTTTTPFGYVVAPLRPWRKTFFVRRFTPAPPAEPEPAADRRIAFEHRAVVRAADGTPLAVVHEHFLEVLF